VTIRQKKKKKRKAKHSNFENKVNLGFSIARIQKIKIEIIIEFLYMVEVGTQKSIEECSF
jgi:hypothetical protein